MNVLSLYPRHHSLKRTDNQAKAKFFSLPLAQDIQVLLKTDNVAERCWTRAISVIFPILGRYFSFRFPWRAKSDMRYDPRKKTALVIVAVFLSWGMPMTALASAPPPVSPALDAAMKELAKTEQPSEKLMTDLATLTQKEPQNYQAHFLLAICYQRIGLPDQALPELKLASQYGPNDPAPILGLIREAVHLGQRDLAMQIASVAYQKFPTNPEVAFWQANFVLQRGNRLAEANALFDKVVRSGMRSAPS